jgi:hypothetical protein
MNTALANQTAAPGFLARDFLLQWSTGVSRFYWYAWNNVSWGTLWTTTSGIQPAGVAYGQVYNWIEGSTISSPCVMAHDFTWTCTFTRSGGDQAIAIWNSAGTISYTAASQYDQYLDLAGNKKQVHGTVMIGYDPILLVTPPVGMPTNLNAIVH